MTGSTKILTVSYGTFSCTLEGFDDPMGTMRDIAEYFRDLAADDRYFGAEPPTPDVEMLQNIARKDAQRQVQARVSETGVSLVAAPVAASQPNVVEQPAAPVEDVASRIAARVAEDKAVSESATEVVEAQEDIAADNDKGPLAFDDDYLLSDEPDDILAVDPDAQVIADHGPAESVAEKLRRIRAVVSKNIELEEPEDRKSFSWDQAQDATGPAKRDRAKTETLNDISAGIVDDEDAQFEASAEAKNSVVEPEDTASNEETHSDSLPGAAAEFEGDKPAGKEEFVDSEDDADQPSPQSSNNAEAATKADADERPESERPVEKVVSDVLGNVLERAAKEEAKTNEETSAESEAQADRQVGRRSTRPMSPIEEDKSVGRLIAETDTKLNEDDVQRRQRVISQMRAAVVATKADRILSRNPVTKEEAIAKEESPYRQDLNAAVKGKAKPDATKTAAPLVLVSSQRIDKEAGGDRESDHTNTAQDVNAVSSAGFNDFAQTVGAKELPELLEAAAAYSAFVEGQSSFTRPEIMRRVARFDPALRLTREDGLRSFGQLLRQGTFRKLERGQFTIDEDTRFHPGQRIAGE